MKALYGYTKINCKIEECLYMPYRKDKELTKQGRTERQVRNWLNVVEEYVKL